MATLEQEMQPAVPFVIRTDGVGTHLAFSGAAQRQFGLAVRGKANGLIDAPGFAATNNGALLSADSHGKQWFVRTQSLLQAKGRWLAACRATNIERS